MMRSNARTQTIDCEPGQVRAVEQKETAFEKQRGVGRLEIRDGFCQVHVVELEKPLSESRLGVLRAIAADDISIDFMKLTPSGLSFVIAQDRSEQLESSLSAIGVKHSLHTNRSILTVFAVNMRDEEGLMAEVVRTAITSGSKIDHIGDGHDRLLLVAERSDALAMRSHIEKELVLPQRRAQGLNKA